MVGLGKNGDVTLVGEDPSRATRHACSSPMPRPSWPDPPALAQGAKADMERAGNGVGRLKVDIRPVTQALKGKPYSGEGGDALGRPSCCTPRPSRSLGSWKAPALDGC